MLGPLKWTRNCCTSSSKERQSMHIITTSERYQAEGLKYTITSGFARCFTDDHKWQFNNYMDAIQSFKVESKYL